MAELTAGVALIDITPPAGLMMAGFAARDEPASGMHDPITVRALVVGDTAIVAADVIGIQKDMSARIREKCCLPAGNVVVAATHTHGAPTSMAERLALSPDPGFLKALEEGCVAAIDQAAASAVPARLAAGYGSDPCVARNRRHEDGLLDRSLPVVRVRTDGGKVIAVLASYACHPTVLGADNRLMTADFPHYVRVKLEAAHPGAIAIFVNGCAGDVNIGHTAQASWTTNANEARSFENAERLGTRIAKAALRAPDTPAGTGTAACEQTAELPLERREGDLLACDDEWQRELDGGGDPVRAMLLRHWVRWARANAGVEPGTISGRVALMEWGDVAIVALPGEIFAETALSIRTRAAHRVVFVISYADDTPGYIPPASEFQFGGYEVDEAYRFVGQPGRFAPGCAEKLAEAAQNLLTVSSKKALRIR